MNAPPEFGLRLAQTSKRSRERDGKLIEIIRSAVGQRVVRLAPDALVGIEFGRIRREALQVEARVSAAEVPDRLALVRLAVVPDDDEVAPQMPEQVPEELASLCLLDVLAMQLEIQADAPAVGADGERRDGGDLVVFVVVLGDRGLATRPPGTADRGDQEEAGFVDESDMGAQPRGVFFTRRQSRRFQASMASSFRCSARRAGFWQLQPSEWSNRPTWSR